MDGWIDGWIKRCIIVGEGFGGGVSNTVLQREHSNQSFFVEVWVHLWGSYGLRCPQNESFTFIKAYKSCRQM